MARDYKYVNPANPFISGIRAIKDALAGFGPMKVNKDERLREIRYLINQSLMPENKRVRSVDHYIAKLLDEHKVDTPELETVRDIVTEVGFALEEYKASVPINQLDNTR